jgi:hypothetical protein
VVRSTDVMVLFASRWEASVAVRVRRSRVGAMIAGRDCCSCCDNRMKRVNYAVSSGLQEVLMRSSYAVTWRTDVSFNREVTRVLANDACPSRYGTTSGALLGSSLNIYLRIAITNTPSRRGCLRLRYDGWRRSHYRLRKHEAHLEPLQ